MLLCGAHELNTDTIIVLHANHKKREIALISLPRDLFYKDRKITGIYRTFGPAQMAKDISEITGLNIEKYAVIDMYAFIDAVNILGGIDITLREDLIDPTMRVKDDGRWSTLYYEKGTHHLNGLEALRIARARHYSSDFGRSEKQQQILSSLKEKVTDLNLGNMGKIYDLIHTLIKYLDTNFTPIELANLINKHRDSAVTDQVVLDTSNVLYHTYSNLYYLGKEADEVDDDFYKGAWILLPLENDWNVIRWYVRKIVQGDGDERYSAEENTG